MGKYFEKGKELKLKGIDGRYVIEKVIGRGSSCVVYSAKFYNPCGDSTTHLIKEFNPKLLDLIRENGVLKPKNAEDGERFEFLKSRFAKGFQRQSALRNLPSLKNYTANVQNVYRDHGTVFVDMTETEGRLYSEVDESSLLGLAERIKVLAQVIGNYHKHGFLHLDIKPGNIFVRPDTETNQDVLLFDFDSLIPFTEKNGQCVLDEDFTFSYTTEYAPVELLCASRRNKIGKATDLYQIGEIFFEKLMGRHSTAFEHNPWADFCYDFSAPILENVNPKVAPILDELFHRTLCSNVSDRFASADELTDCLDKIIALANPERPYLHKKVVSVAPHFIERETEIEEIHKSLKENNLLFLSGMGGIGKSELAKKYANVFAGEYDAVIFAPFVTDIQSMIANDTFVPIHNFYKYPAEKEPEYFERKMRELSKLCDERTLLIVDNLDTTEDENLKILFSLNCKILVTTRRDFSALYSGAQLDVGALANPAKIFDEHYPRPLTDDARLCVNQIIDIVCGHTLTVELLAKQMLAGRVKPEEMLKKLQNGGIIDSGKEKVWSYKDGDASLKNTYEHIRALFDLSELDQDEKYILANLSLIPYTGISSELFVEWCKIDSYDIINRLVAEGWIRWAKSEDYISLHPTIAVVSRNIAKSHPETYDNIAKSARKYVSEKNSSGLAAPQRKERSDLVLTIAKNLLICDVQTEEVATFFQTTPTSFRKYGQLPLAIACRKQALSIRQNLFGEKSEYTANSYSLLGAMYRLSQDFTTAKELLEKALNIRLALFGEEHEDVAASYYSLGYLYLDLKQFDLAEQYLLKSLRLRETLPECDDDDIASACLVLGNNCTRMERYAEAEQYILRALDLRRNLFGEKHEDISRCYNDLGVLYSCWGKLDQAKKYEELSLEQKLFFYGEIHSATDIAYKNLGRLCKKRKEFAEAEYYYQKSFEIRKILYGESHPKTLKVKELLSELPSAAK